MKILVLVFIFSNLLFGVSFSTLYEVRGKGYDNSNVYIDGEFTSYRCSINSGLNNSRDNYCKVFLDVIENGKFISSVAVFVGTTWESDFKNAKRGDTYSFSCTYKNSLSTFKYCN